MAQTPQGVAVEQPVDPAPAGPAQITRKARAVLGWMTEESALHLMCSMRGDIEPTEEQRQRAAEARAAVAARAPEPLEDDSEITQAAPEEVLAAFGANRVQAATEEGFQVRMVDLERVRALQTHVMTEAAIERVAGIDEDDLAGLTQLTLPEAQPTRAPLLYDESQKAWTVLVPDLNMRIVQPFHQQVTDQSGRTFPVLGFVFGALPSVVKVMEYQGRYVLTDGYHRAFGLLSRGISRVPALVGHAENFEDMKIPQGLLPQGQWLGARPPRLDDYLVDAVSETIDMPVQQRLIVIQALESTLGG